MSAHPTPYQRIGLISDTHGLLRPEVLAYLRGSDLLIHAGDICDPDILDELRVIAPVVAVRGNNDFGGWAERLRETELIKFGELRIFTLHDLADLEIAPAKSHVRVVVFGHSHDPLIQTRDGVLFVNPGSAGPRRFRLPIAAGELLVRGSEVEARICKF